ncbi:MAG: redoxin family protein [Mogibacterium sp.]|nr:redoxin family protein [Mogibacterium sp.]
MDKKRKLIQLYCALLYNAHVRGFIEGEIYTGNVKAVCVPGLNCYSCPGAAGACPLGSLQNALASSGKRAGWYVLGILTLMGVILGRTVCGWLCPFGLIQELFYKLPTPKVGKSRFTKALSYLKYVILVVFAVIIPLWYGLTQNIPVPGFCKYICPAGTLEGAVGLLSNARNADKFSMLGLIFTRKFIILVLVLLFCTFFYRCFCRFICPLGAILGLFNRYNIIGVKVDTERCNGCGACVRTCRMDVTRVGDHECINCAKCMGVCPQSAISFKAGKVTMMAPEAGCRDDKPDSADKRKRYGRVGKWVALALLCFALLWYNVLDPSVRATAGGDVVPDDGSAASYEVGSVLTDFSVVCLDGSTFHLADARGKVVFINLWATYCGPCVKELPEFCDLSEDHDDDVVVIAIHSGETVTDVGEFVQSQGWTIPFAIDSADGELFGILGGSSMLPQTIVLDRDGRVIYNQTGSVDRDKLERLYEEAAGASASESTD